MGTTGVGHAGSSWKKSPDTNTTLACSRGKFGKKIEEQEQIEIPKVVNTPSDMEGDVSVAAMTLSMPFKITLQAKTNSFGLGSLKSNGPKLDLESDMG